VSINLKRGKYLGLVQCFGFQGRVILVFYKFEKTNLKVPNESTSLLMWIHTHVLYIYAKLLKICCIIGYKNSENGLFEKAKKLDFASKICLLDKQIIIYEKTFQCKFDRTDWASICILTIFYNFRRSRKDTSLVPLTTSITYLCI
jgi:hypothetical protein